MAYKVVLYSGKSVQIAWDTLKQQISLWDLERINKIALIYQEARFDKFA